MLMSANFYRSNAPSSDFRLRSEATARQVGATSRRAESGKFEDDPPAHKASAVAIPFDKSCSDQNK